MTTWRSVALTLLLSAIAVAGVLAYRHLTPSPGATATTLELSRLDGPGTARLADWHGTPVVVNLFASWCPSCLSEMPALERASHDYAGRAVIVGVDSQDSSAAGQRFARQLGVTYPLLVDTNHSDLYRSLQGQGMPVTAFIRRDGSVMRVYSGEIQESLLRQLIGELLDS